MKLRTVDWPVGLLTGMKLLLRDDLKLRTVDWPVCLVTRRNESAAPRQPETEDGGQARSFAHRNNCVNKKKRKSRKPRPMLD